MRPNLFIPMLLLAAACTTSHAQTPVVTQLPASTDTAEDTTPTPGSGHMFPHTEKNRFFAAGQANIIFQANTPFHSPYEGVNSFESRGAYKTSLVGTLYLGAQLVRNPRYSTDLIVNFESAGGRGLSQALGLAGFTNLDVVRNPNLGSKPYLARIQIRQTIGLTSKMIAHDRDQGTLPSEVPEKRVEVRIGKMSLPDTFDANGVGSDSHLQFTNWTIDNQGAWDYAADTRGYTWGAIASLETPKYTVRYGIATMPTVANGIDVDYALRRASGQNMEFVARDAAGLKGTTVRVLSFVNHADMGTYRVANRIALATGTTPDVTTTRVQGTVKYGFGLNLEQQLPGNFRAYGRFGWNEGQHESFAYTEVDQSISGGLDYNPVAWGRSQDRMGIAFVSNAIKQDHQHYLAMGGLGFLLGDGKLNYAREDITEIYYNAHVWRGMSFAMGGSVIFHPGYNQDRGPILVPSVRTHFDF
jgi:high affinity Mn2+ porin